MVKFCSNNVTSEKCLVKVVFMSPFLNRNGPISKTYNLSKFFRIVLVILLTASQSRYQDVLLGWPHIYVTRHHIQNQARRFNLEANPMTLYNTLV